MYGISTFVANLVMGLKDECDITLVLTIDNERALQPREAEMVSLGAKIRRTCDIRGIKSTLIHGRLLYKLLKEGSYDVFHANMELFNGYNMFIAWLAGVPVRVCHSHNSNSQWGTAKGKHYLKRIFRAIMRRLCWTFSNRRCGCSTDALDYMFPNKWSNDPHSAVINNGIDLSRYTKSAALNGGSKGHNIISVGRLMPQKNPLFVISVLTELKKMRTDWHFNWAGGGPLMGEMVEKINLADLTKDISMLGERKDIPDLLANSEVFLMPSCFEGLGIALIEAQASGLICVVSDRIPLLADCGLCEFVSLEKTPAEWAQIISDVLDKKITKEIDQEKLNQFGFENLGKQLMVLYDGNQ